MFARRGEKRCRLFWTSKSKKIRQAQQLFRISRRARSRRSFVSGQEVACQLAAELSVRGLQVTGEATYVDDIPLPANTLYAAVVPSTHAHAKLLSVDPSEAIKVSTACDSGSPLSSARGPLASKSGSVGRAFLRISVPLGMQGSAAPEPALLAVARVCRSTTMRANTYKLWPAFRFHSRHGKEPAREVGAGPARWHSHTGACIDVILVCNVQAPPSLSHVTCRRPISVVCSVQAPGVAGFFGARDVPGDNRVGAVVHDEDLFADGLVTCVGQPIGVIVADSEAQARSAARWRLPPPPNPAHPALSAVHSRGSGG